LRSGERGRVVSVDPSTDSLVVALPGDRHQRVPSEHLESGRLVHAYATTPYDFARSLAVRPGDHRSAVDVLVLGDACRFGTDVGAQVGQMRAYAVAPETQRLARLPRAAALSLAELVPERDRLARELARGAPPDPARDLRLASEERAWAQRAAAGTEGADRRRWQARLERATEREARLEERAGERRAWAEAKRADLERHAAFSEAVELRRRLLGRAAEVAPSAHLVAALGPCPSAGTERATWRRAAQGVESYRERWSVHDSQALGDDAILDPRQRAERSTAARSLEAASRVLLPQARRSRAFDPDRGRHAGLVRSLDPRLGPGSAGR
jgi:hypothetical protein